MHVYLLPHAVVSLREPAALRRVCPCNGGRLRGAVGACYYVGVTSNKKKLLGVKYDLPLLCTTAGGLMQLIYVVRCSGARWSVVVSPSAILQMNQFC